jgi:hypothetical protein
MLMEGFIMIAIRGRAAVLTALLLATGMIGCDPTMENRVPSAEEIDEARDRRIEAIDKMDHLSDEQKAMMKSRIGAPAQAGGGRAASGAQ